jgi:hypothetical protein
MMIGMTDLLADLERRLHPFPMSKRTALNIDPCHPMLKRLVYEGLHYVDFTVTTGFRGKADQEAALRGGFSKAAFGQSPHNYKPALAIDAYLNPIDVNSAANCKALARVLRYVAITLDVPLLWGGDYRGKFKDLPHFELADWEAFK